jgi:hypothetical protein
MPMETISFIVAETRPLQTAEGTKSVFGSASVAEVVLKSLPLDRVKENLTNATNGFLKILADIREVGQFKQSEVQIQIEVSAEGGVDFIGTSKVGGKGAITLTFKTP